MLQEFVITGHLQCTQLLSDLDFLAETTGATCTCGVTSAMAMQKVDLFDLAFRRQDTVVERLREEIVGRVIRRRSAEVAEDVV